MALQGYFYGKGDRVTDGDKIGTVVVSAHSHWHSMIKWDDGTKESMHTEDIYLADMEEDT